MTKFDEFAEQKEKIEQLPSNNDNYDMETCSVHKCHVSVCQDEHKSFYGYSDPWEYIAKGGEM